MGASSGTRTIWSKRDLSRRIVMLLSCVLAALSLGCSNSWGTKGTWMGTLVPLDLLDHEGHVYRGVALQNVKGPEYHPKGPDATVWGWKFTGEIPAEVGSGRAPVLVADDPPRIIELNELPPLGEYVRIEGRMVGTLVFNPRTQRERGDRAISRVGRKPDDSNVFPEHALIVHRIKAIKAKE